MLLDGIILAKFDFVSEIKVLQGRVASLMPGWTCVLAFILSFEKVSRRGDLGRAKKCAGEQNLEMGTFFSSDQGGLSSTLSSFPWKKKDAFFQTFFFNFKERFIVTRR